MITKIKHSIIPGEPMAKPRQTRSDKWKRRPCVVRYRQWADKARIAVFGKNQKGEAVPEEVSIMAVFKMPKSWSKNKRCKMRGTTHKQTPDWDNIGKAVCDALWDKDQEISAGMVFKFWDDGRGARTEILITKKD